MRKPNRPEKLDNLLKRIYECLESGKYSPKLHSKERMLERFISLPDVLYVLKNGYHEQKKDSFKKEFNTWNYAIRGNTLDKLDVRVVVAFDDEGMLIITVMAVNNRRLQ